MATKRKLEAVDQADQQNKKPRTIAPSAKGSRTKQALSKATKKVGLKKPASSPAGPTKSINSNINTPKVRVPVDVKESNKNNGRQPNTKQMRKNAAAHYHELNAKFDARSRASPVKNKYVLQTVQYKSKNGAKEGVLFRPTLRATRTKASQKAQQNPKPGNSGQSSDSTDDTVTSKPFRVMELPRELRDAIWELAVVNTTSFVHPDTDTGKEQPDLAMTSRQVRNEVLPIYYGKNVFAVEVTGPLQITTVAKRWMGKGVQIRKGIPALEKWAAQLETGQKWFSSIRQWAFCCMKTSPCVGVTNSNVIDLGPYKEDLVIASVNFRKPKDCGWTASVEIHGQAPCILSGHNEYATCEINLTPKWLNTVVREVTDACDSEGPSKGLVVGIARSVRLHGSELFDSRCKQVAKKLGEGWVEDEAACIVIED